ncbi:CYTH domain-containing protein [Halomonas sp. MCCC 1A17488]|uniref:CYTH domain-containing protein n=1 Tax=unclassified Halomonas TaxID=2609666 RepID=UPI0018D21C2B|nr:MULTISPECIES: CYTH domain-containing protein [unclassified Halomonas]MCE8016651.1 CYTH domain-containing protein [Halomonas sp. MCCC 1A17488]MCG3239984.1 CYTH domain-containing protein [Halomonas sp. MCCC 1A17488]QPP50126.1 CYTH domain-containing protein [Halomonas sp. SS10-MC5]
MSEEIEMKLALGETGPERLLQHPFLRGGVDEAQRLANTYFDTPEGDLEAARMALRLRRRDERWVQTLKTSGEGSGGFSRRREWEWPVASGSLDRAGLAALPPVAALGEEVLARLEPRFSTDFERRAWRLELAEASIEVALDQGEIRAAGRRVPIHELELELKDGDPQALWSLALAFAETVPLRPAEASKAVRGSALLSGRWTLPQGSAESERLRRALLALDAWTDTGDDEWKATARQALQAIAADGDGDAGTLAAMLQRRDWLDVDFGRVAVRLAHRLAP